MKGKLPVIALASLVMPHPSYAAWPIQTGHRVGDQLSPGQVLQGNTRDYLSTSFDNFQLIMQEDCNLVLYNGAIPLWNSQTNGSGTGCTAIMQNDGNFVVYNSSQTPVWNAGTQGNPGAWLHMQDDGNAVIYTGNRAIWASGTNDQGWDLISMPQQSGNTTVYRIDRPTVIQPRTQYPQIQFSLGDTLNINAGGCVQTGGSGETWKSYTNPLGDNAGSLYSGTIYIPGLIPQTGGPSGYPRIAGWMNRSLIIPSTLPPAISQSQLILNLGYEDNDYSDNGYWGHDDGNPPQCINIGPAWVEITVTTAETGTASQGQQSAQRPFDFVWDTNKLDRNALPLNPIWAYQIKNPAGTPDFQAICDAAFSGGDTINVSLLSAICTSQDPTPDLSHSSFDAFGYCHGDPLKGHLNWMLATYTGTLWWSEYSGNYTLEDDDFNFNLVPPNNAGLTDLNKGALGLEFNAGETIDNFDAPFWVLFRDQVYLGTQLEAGGLVNGKPAVVTGLMGIDGVHGGYTESHPVFAMAIRINEQAAGNGVDETWAFFVRNSGDEGGCSHLIHDWVPASGSYYLSLPWPQGATTVSVVASGTQAWAYGMPGNSAFLETAPGWPWTYVAFQLADPSAGAGVYGQITIHYELGSQQKAQKGPEQSRAAYVGGALPSSAPPLGHAEEGGGLGKLESLIPDVSSRERFHKAVIAMATTKRAPRVGRFPVTVDPQIRVYNRVLSPAQSGAIVRDRVRFDARMGARQLESEQAVLKLFPPSVLESAAHADDCAQGFVWREAFSEDRVCVTPASRTQAAKDNQLVAARRIPNEDECQQGFVWRNAGPSDHVCVLPATRQQAADENRLAGSRRAKNATDWHSPPLRRR
jgi:hypothetical protein